MANWYGVARSNRFKVKDVDAFKEDLSGLELDITVENGLILLFSDTEYGSWPSGYFCDEEDDFLMIDLEGIIQEHIVDGEVAILMEVGNEKLRYVTGTAVAISSDRVERISLDAIYDIARSMTDKEINIAEY